MNSVQAAAGDALVNGARRQAQRPQLLQSEHGVLPAGESR